MADNEITTQDIYEGLNAAADRRAGRIADPLLREAMGTFNRKGLFSECHETLSNKILDEVARRLKGLGLDVRIQDSVEVCAYSPGGCVVEIRREGDSYQGKNRSEDGSKVYWEGTVRDLSHVEEIVKAGR